MNQQTNIASAHFKGKDILGFEKGQNYRIQIVQNGNKVSVSKATGGPAITYQSHKDYLKDWGNIRIEKAAPEKCIITITQNENGQMHVDIKEGKIDIFKLTGIIETVVKPVLASKIRPSNV